MKALYERRSSALCRVLLVALAAIVSRDAFAQPRPDALAVETRAAAAAQFIDRFSSGWTLRFDDRTGTPTSIFLEFPGSVPTRVLRSIPAQGADATEKATSFLSEYKTLFSFRPGTDDVRLRPNVSFDDHAKFDQLYKGVRVHRGSLAFTVRNGAVSAYSGTFFPNISVTTAPAVSARQAERSAVTSVDPSMSREVRSTELVVFPADGSYALAYEVALRAGTRSYRVFVDAVGGGVLSVEDLTMEFAPGAPTLEHASSAPSASISPVMIGGLAFETGHGLPTGTGKAYPDNPRDTPVANVQLPRLNGNGRLQGTYATAKNLAAADAYSATNAFSYATTDTHFDEANVYYHVDRFGAHLSGRGFVGMGRSQVAQVHWNADNAQFDPGSLVLRFGDGGTVFNATVRENDIVYHEYGHAVQDRYGIQYDGGETGAFQEATSDFLAASYANEPYIGEWATKCTDVGHLRSLATSRTTFNYANRNNIEYAYCSARSSYLAPKVPAQGSHYSIGMVWSGAVWDLRGAAGTETTEKLVVKSLSYLSAYPSFANARDALIQADNALYSGANNCKIQDALGRRGVGSVCPSDVPSGLRVTNLGATTGSPQLQWTAPAAGGASSYKVYRSVDWNNDPPQVIATVTTTSYTDTALQSSHLGASGGAFYTVAAIKNGVQSAKSNEAYAFVKAPGQPFAAGPAAPVVASAVPDVFAVHGVGPNPLRGSGALRVDLPEGGRVTARVYDTLGRLVLTVEDGERPAGHHALAVNAGALPAGLYVYRVEAGASSASGTFTVVR